MKALSFLQVNHIGLVNVNQPTARSGDVVVKTKVTSSSVGTETAILRGAKKLPLKLKRMGKISTYSFPLIPGYEGVGEIVEKGSSVKNFDVGERVFFGHTLGPYGEYCSMWGGDVEYAVVPEKQLLKIPDNISYEEVSAGLFLTALAVQSVIYSNISLGCSIGVVGQGAVGLLISQLSSVLGIELIIVTDLYENRLKMASELGATDTINARKENVVKKIDELTDGKGVDISFEAVGQSETLMQAIKIAGDRGQVMIVAQHNKPILIDPYEDIYSKSLTIKSVGNCEIRNKKRLPKPLDKWTKNWQFQKALELIASGKIKINPLITNRLSYKEFNSFFNLLEDYPGKIIKPVFIW